MVRLLLLDIEALDLRHAVREVQIEMFDDYYKYLDCDTFDIANRQVGNTRYDLFVDAEELLKQNPRISAVNKSTQEPMLVGNIIFAKHDMSGETVGLSDADIRNIKENIAVAIIQGEIRPLLLCEY